MAPPIEHQLAVPLPTKQKCLESIKLAIAQKTQHDFGGYLSEQQLMQGWVIL